MNVLKKILVIRFSSIGDIVLTTPVIRCLNQQTDAEIHFVTKTKYASLFEANPYVDKVHHFKEEVTEIINDLKTERFDFIVDLHRNFRSIRLRKSLGIKSATFPKLNVQKFFFTNFKWNLMPDIHIVDRYFKSVNKLGVKNDGKGLDHFIPKSEKVNLDAYHIPNEFVAFSIGAQYATKRLPNKKIIEIIQQINKTVVLLGGPTDEDNATIIENQCEKSINLVGQLSVHQSASILEQSQVVISHDTGLMHITAALKKPLVTIWGNTVPDFGMYPYLPNNEDLYSIHEVDVNCRPCSKIGYQSCPKKHFKCMFGQDINEIVLTVNKYMD